MKYPDGREVRYGYDESRRIREITSGDFRVDYTYDGLGRLARIGRGNGVESLYRYDGEGRLSGLVHQNGEGILEAFDYGYDIMGNRTCERRSSSQEGYKAVSFIRQKKTKMCHVLSLSEQDPYYGCALLPCYNEKGNNKRSTCDRRIVLKGDI